MGGLSPTETGEGDGGRGGGVGGTMQCLRLQHIGERLDVSEYIYICVCRGKRLECFGTESGSSAPRVVNHVTIALTGARIITSASPSYT